MEYLGIVILGLLMGIVSAISGGSGVFAVPTLLAFGLPPVDALVLNRSSDIGVSTGAFWNYLRSKAVDWKLVLRIAPILALGSYFGARLIVTLPEEWVPWIVFVGILVGAFFLVNPVKKTREHLKAPLWLKSLGYFLFFLVGMWNGGLAMAGATFAVLVFVYCFGCNFLEGRSTTLMASIPDVLISVSVLYSASTVNILWVLTMIVSSFVGAWIGSHLAVKHGSRFIRVMMLVVAGLMMVKVAFDLLG